MLVDLIGRPFSVCKNFFYPVIINCTQNLIPSHACGNKNQRCIQRIRNPVPRSIVFRWHTPGRDNLAIHISIQVGLTAIPDSKGLVDICLAVIARISGIVGNGEADSLARPETFGCDRGQFAWAVVGLIGTDGRCFAGLQSRSGQQILPATPALAVATQFPAADGLMVDLMIRRIPIHRCSPWQHKKPVSCSAGRAPWRARMTQPCSTYCGQLKAVHWLNINNLCSFADDE